MTSIKLKPVLIALDFSEADLNIFAFLQQNLSILDKDRMHFIHVNESTENRSFDKEELTKNIAVNVPEGIEHEIHIKQGDVEDEIAIFRKANDINLLVLGHKKSDHHNVEIKRLVKRPACSLLLIPKLDSYPIKKIGVAIDFSDLSMKALTAAAQMAKASGASLVGLHSYQVPSGYHKSGKDHEEFAQIMENNAREEAASFLKQAGSPDITMEYIYDKNNKPAECIASCTKDHEIDLLLLGSKGRTNGASILMGSVAKSVAQQLFDTPLLIIKENNENMDVVDALKKV